MDYSKLSDCEIAHMVSQKLPGRYITYADHVMDSETEETFDPCNNPADAWPIILQKGIAVAPPIRNERGWVSWCSVNEYTVFKTRDANPLRAAMIVFLMMQGDE